MVEETKKKHKFMKESAKNMEEVSKPTFGYAHENDSGATGKQARLAENLIKAGHHRAEKVHKASASHKTIRQSMYGHKE